MSYKYIGAKELKNLKKERLDLMRDAEVALKDENYDLLIQHFTKIIEISEKIGDDEIKNEFLEKLAILNSNISKAGSTEQIGQAQNIISDFINDLMKSSNYIVREATKPIIISPSTDKAVSGVEGAPKSEEAVISPTEGVPLSKETVAPSTEKAPPIVTRKVAPPPISPRDKSKPVEEIDIEEEIKRSGPVEKQLEELKKILQKQDKKKVTT